MNFAQALARIDKLWNLMKHTTDEEHEEIQQLLCQHTDSLLQLAKVAADMRRGLIIEEDEIDADWDILIPSAESYDKLMNGEER